MLELLSQSTLRVLKPAAMAGVGLVPIVQAVQRTLTDNIFPVENAFAASEPSSALANWLLSSQLGNWLDWFGQVGMSLGKEFIPEQSIAEHQQQLKHYAAKLTNELMLDSFGKNVLDCGSTFCQSNLLDYVYHAKVLLRKTDGRMAPKIHHQLNQFFKLAQLQGADIARPFEELIMGLERRYPRELRSGSVDVRSLMSISGTSHVDELSHKGRGFAVDKAQRQRVSRLPRIGQANPDTALADISLGSLDGNNGFSVLGDGCMGFSVSSAGDVNGDGFSDVIIGTCLGGSYVIFGNNATDFELPLELSMLDGTNGFAIGETYDEGFGHSVSGAGDVNGDGFSDVIIGAPYAHSGRLGKPVGESYVIFGKKSFFDANFTLSSLDGSNGFILIGEAKYDGVGYSVSGAGDVNGDGIADLIIGAPTAGSNSGRSYVVFGRDSSFDVNFALSSLDGSNGFNLVSQVENEQSGYSVSGAEDVNGDGFSDVVIGARYSSRSYVVFGRDSPFESSFVLSSLDGSNGFTLLGETTGEWPAHSVSGAGDVNGDGFDDVIIGAPGDTSGDMVFLAGKSYVVFGRGSPFESIFALSNLDGSNGFVLVGEAEYDRAGYSVSGAGDVNDDGFDDVIIGAPYADPAGVSAAGESYVVFGKDSPFNASFPLWSLDGINGFTLVGQAYTDNSGWSVSGAGDVNGDGFDDVIIGSPDATASLAGKSYVVYGEIVQIPVLVPTPTPVSSEVELSNIDNVDGFTLKGSGWSVSGAGDVNGDGFDDVIIGSPHAALGEVSDVGKSYVVFGRRFGFEPLDLSKLDGANGFVLIGEAECDRAGYSVSGAGDVNGDGFDDVIIGAPDADPGEVSEAGKSYVVFSNGAFFNASFALSSLDGINGFALIGQAKGDNSGYSVSGAGDVNGDGFSDVVIGAPYADLVGGYDVGKSYVVFGRDSPFESSFALSKLDGANGFVLVGEAEDDRTGYSVSGAGDVNGDGFSDVIIGAPGEPPVSLSCNSYVIFGKGSSFEVNVALSRLDGINGFTLTGTGYVGCGSSGQSVSGAGDVNGDGFSDVITGVIGADNAGSYVVFGQRSFFGASLTLSSLDGNNGFILTTEASFRYAGWSVSGAGDMNDDGFSDVAIGVSSTGTGYSYVVFGKGSSFDASVILSSVDGTNGFALIGDGSSGQSISGAGDVNGDGFSDVLIGAPYASKSYVAFGGLIQVQAPVLPSPPPPTPAPSVAPTPSVFETDLSNLDGANGLTIAGEVEADHVGYSVSGAGDMNGDGFDDVIIGAPYSDTHGIWSGKSYVVFGNASIAESMLDLATIETDATRGFVLAGEASYDYLGFSVAHAGDVNHDGIDDVIIGAYRADTNSANSGKAYVVFGSRLGFGLPLDLSRLDGNNGFALLGEAEFDGLGYSVNAAGDMNGDKVDDVVVGAPFASTTGLRSGKSYVVFGSALGFESSFSLSSLDGSNGFALLGEASGDWLGFSVSGAGDVNGDGIDDVILGAPSAKLNGNGVGKSYVVFGRVSGFESSLGLSSLDGINGFTVPGETEDDMFGYSVGGIGDMNGDGFDDVIIGAPDAVNKIEDVEVETGKGYVIFGKDTQFDKFFTLANLNGRNGFVVIGGAEGDRAGYSVSGAGDVNGDGFSDVIIGAPLAGEEEPGAGKSYVILGKRTGFSASIGLSALGSNGFVLTGAETGDRAGYSVSGAGDVNGDGADDVLIGAPFSDVDSEGVEDVGASYVVFGDSPSPTPTSSLSSGQIAGIAVGAVAGLAVVGAIGKFGFWDRYVSDDPAREPLIQQARPVMP